MKKYIYLVVFTGGMKQAITLAALLAVALPAVADDRCDKEPTYYNINPGSLYSSSIIIFADNQRLGTNFNMYIHTADIGRPKIPEKMFGVLPAAEKPGLELLYMVSETGVFPHDRSYLMSLDGTLSEPVYLEGHKLPHSLCQRKIIGPDNNPVGSTNFVVVYTAEKQPQLKSVCEGNTTYLKIDPNWTDPLKTDT